MPVRLRDAPPNKPHLSQRSRTYRWRRRFERWLLQAYRLPAPSSNSAITRLPILFRPAVLALTFLTLIVLLVFGIHPTLARALHVNDKIQHFVAMALATGLFYFIFQVEDSSRKVMWWRLFPEVATLVVCFLGGGVVSEFVQSLLPYKTFQVLDVVANLMGSTVGLLVARATARRMRHRRELAELYQPLDELESEPEGDEEAAVNGRSALAPEMSENTSARPPTHKKATVNDVWRDDSSDGFSLAGDEENDDLTRDELDQEIARLER